MQDLILKNEDRETVEVLEILSECEAILRGHFVLNSGLHSAVYMQCAKIFQRPYIAEKLCLMFVQKIAAKFGKGYFDLVVSPALGGIIFGYEMARVLEAEAIFCERNQEGVFCLKRNFNIPKNAKILLAEDVITTGKAISQVINCISEQEGKDSYYPECICSIIDRRNISGSGLSGDFQYNNAVSIPVVSLLQLEVATYEADNLPPHLQSIPACKPGSGKGSSPHVTII